MTWKIGGHRIYVEKDSGWQSNPRKGQIDLLDTAYSIIHVSGRESLTRKVTFVIFANYETNILPLVSTSIVTFEDSDGVVSNVTILKQPETDRLYNYRDTLDSTEIYRISMVLMLDEQP